VTRRRGSSPPGVALPSSDGAVRLIQGDALTVLATLPPASFDACICDPPHGVLKQQSWDQLQPVELWREVWRVLKAGAPIIVIGAPRTYHRMVCAIEDAGFIVDDLAVWAFTTGRPPSPNRLKPGHAPILIAFKPGPRRPINLAESRLPFVDGRDREQTRRIDTLRATGRRRGGIYDASMNGNARERAPFEPKAGRYPANVMATDPIDLRCDRFFLVPRVRDSKAHPAAKPILLMAQLLRAFVRPGGQVLDPFGGGGTTGVAALATGRRAVLIERDPAFAAMANANLQAGRKGDFRLPRSLPEASDPGTTQKSTPDEIMSDHEHMPGTWHERSSGNGADDQHLRTAEQMSGLLGASVVPLTLRRWARAGRIPGVKIGRDWMFVPDDVIAALTPTNPRPQEAPIDADATTKPRQVRRPGLQSGPAEGNQSPFVPAGRRPRRSGETGARVRSAGRRMGCSSRADSPGTVEGPLRRAALDPDQAARLSDLLGVPVHPVGQGPSRPDDL
jgi:site-specific DNA-methyltransferase (adenine-specific)